MTTGRWIGFSLVWFALAVFTFESIHARRRQQLAARRRGQRGLTYSRLSFT